MTKKKLTTEELRILAQKQLSIAFVILLITSLVMTFQYIHSRTPEELTKELNKPLYEIKFYQEYLPKFTFDLTDNYYSIFELGICSYGYAIGIWLLIDGVTLLGYHDIFCKANEDSLTTQVVHLWKNLKKHQNKQK